ncbi:DUF6222 family protein [Amycolatopsis sp. cmx-8-4]|uniref:DUF6222 family protein n=1 Tax=Amycolatopsis sp. cmx-8-4 TaxID=2790947 RepID=UPI00397D82EA
MTANNTGRTDAAAARSVEPVEAPIDLTVRPMPRLGRGIVWSDVVAEMKRDLEEQQRGEAA